jgi:probable phosphoglycerate mutase
VTHRGVIRAVFARASGWDLLGKPPVRLDWGALHVFKVDRAGTPSIERLNVR